MSITISQRLVAAVAMIAVMVAGVLTGAKIDEVAWTEAVVVLLTTIAAITTAPPGEGSGDWMALLKDTKFQGAIVAVIAIIGNQAFGFQIDEATLNAAVVAIIGLLVSYAKRPVQRPAEE